MILFQAAELRASSPLTWLTLKRLINDLMKMSMPGLFPFYPDLILHLLGTRPASQFNQFSLPAPFFRNRIETTAAHSRDSATISRGEGSVINAGTLGSASFFPIHPNRQTDFVYVISD